MLSVLHLLHKQCNNTLHGHVISAYVWWIEQADSTVCTRYAWHHTAPMLQLPMLHCGRLCPCILGCSPFAVGMVHEAATSSTNGRLYMIQ